MGKILVVANQKGGVGKSTVTMLYANYLSNTGKKVMVIDADIQQSIFRQRRDDIGCWSEEEMKYPVEYFNITTPKETEKWMLSLKNDFNDLTTIIDMPGDIKSDGNAPVLVHADYLICPFQYERKVLESTTTYIKVINYLRGKFKGIMRNTMIFVPNKIDVRKNSKEQLSQQEYINGIMKNFGKLTEKIPDRVSIERMNTYNVDSKTEELVLPCFKNIDDVVFKNNFLEQ